MVMTRQGPACTLGCRMTDMVMTRQGPACTLGCRMTDMVMTRVMTEGPAYPWLHR